MRLCKLTRLLLVSALFCASIAFAACGEEKATRVIIDDPNRDDPNRVQVGHNLYARPGGLGGTTHWVNVGEIAEVIDEEEVGREALGAIPGEWIKIRTSFDPREGWIERKNTRLAPRD